MTHTLKVNDDTYEKLKVLAKAERSDVENAAKRAINIEYVRSFG